MQQMCYSLRFGIIRGDQLSYLVHECPFEQFFDQHEELEGWFLHLQLQFCDLSLDRQWIMLHIFVLSSCIFLSVKYGQSMFYECYQGVSKSTYGYFMWLMMKSRYKFAVFTQAKKSFVVIIDVLVIWVSANNLWWEIMRNLSNTCTEIPKLWEKFSAGIEKMTVCNFSLKKADFLVM